MNLSNVGFEGLSTYNSGELSPSMTMLPYEECGTCNDDNALCVRVANQTTCWCQSGFIKTANNKCGKWTVFFEEGKFQLVLI